MEPRGLIFDLDGTLADTMPVHYESWVDTLEPLGLTLDEDRFYALGGKPTVVVAQLLIDEAGLKLDAMELTREKESQMCIRDRPCPERSYTMGSARRDRPNI